jgi:hypothetical protein
MNTAVPMLILAVLHCAIPTSGEVLRFSMHEVSLEAARSQTNPYTQIEAEAELTSLDGSAPRRIPLFWDDGKMWKFRFAPDQVGLWKWKINSGDPGLNGHSGELKVVPSALKGSLRPMTGFPRHFARQDDTPFWFLGDTAWALFTDNKAERHDREAAQQYLDSREAQGFNVVHSMLLSEAGWGNAGGPPFHDLAREQINPDYWREVDARIAYANQKGMICGLALAWGDKQRKEPYAWSRFSSLAARERYTRYIAARYSAYNIYFLVSGEWHAEINARESSGDAVKKEFIRLGDVLRTADPHRRMIGIHPMIDHGSVREFQAAAWMSFGDYQQNYSDLHARLLQSRPSSKPLVNSEYGYFLRDQNGDGVPDKENSTSLESIRHATWDIVMAGAYIVTGFGTTYFGGNRDPGPFDLHAEKNKAWEHQIGIVKQIFTKGDWWKLQPHDELVASSIPRGKDRRELNREAPPAVTYWCLADPGLRYLVYARGIDQAIVLSLPAGVRECTAYQINPRTGERMPLQISPVEGKLRFVAPNREDWVFEVTVP